MNMRKLILAIFSMVVGWGMAGVTQAATVSFEAGDRPGNFFACTNTGASSSLGCVNGITPGQKSLAVIAPGETVGFPSVSSEASTIHTVLSLIYPTEAHGGSMPFKRAIDLRHPEPGGVAEVTLNDPGLYVFICDIHVYMFAAVIVDSPGTPELDLGKNLYLVAGPGGAPLPFPTYSDLAIRLLRTFFIVTDPGNWKDYTKDTWSPVFPAVPVIVHDVGGNPIPVADLSAVLSMGTMDLKAHQSRIFKPKKEAVGEIWVDTQFELTAGKAKPGTATAIDGKNWNVTKKVALPEINMNHPHNMWTDKNQEVIYQTQWFSERVAVFDRETGALIRELNAGPAPSHVMTRTTDDTVYVAQNGGDNVRKFDSLANGNLFLFDIPMSIPAQANHDIHLASHPHGHWLSADGAKMVTPNENVHTSTVADLGTNSIDAIPATDAVPIATGMMPDSSKYYVANLLGHNISVIDMTTNTPTAKSPINLIANYDPIGGGVVPDPVSGKTFVGALPIQTPVSPTGTNMVTANTLTASITVVDTRHYLSDGVTVNPAEDTVVAMLPCDPGCHGVQYGAKKGGGYYAYVASKFSNALIVVDPDPNGDGDSSDAAIVGRLLLADKGVHVQDDQVIGNPGMGGQGTLAVPNVYNGWVQNLPAEWCNDLSPEQRNPIGAPVENCPLP